MSILNSITKPANRPVFVTIIGDSGMGKTSLANTFPKPVFIRLEDGLQAIPEAQRPDAFPLISKVDQLWEQLSALIQEEHDYKTVVLDSITAAERLFGQHVIDSDPKKPKSLAQAQGGFGGGYDAVAVMHQRVRKAAGLLNDKGINVVFIGHADTATVDLPDQEPYTKYTVRLHKKSVAPYVDDSDIVAFVKLQTFVMGEEGQKKRAISDGTRVVVTYATAANLSKNRFQIKDDLIFEQGVNPFSPFVPGLE